MKKSLGLICCLFVLLFCSHFAVADVINFDDIIFPTGVSGMSIPTNYSGLTWGTVSLASQGWPEVTSEWHVMWNSPDIGYIPAYPESNPNYVYNAYGGIGLWFSFSQPVHFDGAYFMNYFNLYSGTNSAPNPDYVYFRDDLGHQSAQLPLQRTPQFLTADFEGATTISVLFGPQTTDPRWFAMDDITFNSQTVPEPATMLLLGLGLVGLAGIRRKFKK